MRASEEAQKEKSDKELEKVKVKRKEKSNIELCTGLVLSMKN